MAFNEHLAERISQFFRAQKAPFYEKKMMGGLCFMVDDKMCCGIHFDKKSKMDLLMVRIGEEQYQTEISKPEVRPMDFTGRPMKGYLYVTAEGLDIDEDLEYWLQRCLDFNPLAKSSLKRKKKV